MKNLALLPCPFCGGEGELRTVNSASSGFEGNHYVQCVECCASGGEGDKPKEAVEYWNERYEEEE